MHSSGWKVKSLNSLLAGRWTQSERKIDNVDQLVTSNLRYSNGSRFPSKAVMAVSADPSNGQEKLLRRHPFREVRAQAPTKRLHGQIGNSKNADPGKGIPLLIDGMGLLFALGRSNRKKWRSQLIKDHIAHHEHKASGSQNTGFPAQMGYLIASSKSGSGYQTQ